MTRAWTTKEVFGSPLFIALQLSPPSVLLNIPVPVPAYKIFGLVGSTAIDPINSLFNPTDVQVPTVG